MSRHPKLPAAGKVELVKLVPLPALGVDPAMMIQRVGETVTGNPLEACFVGAGTEGARLAGRLAAVQSLGRDPSAAMAIDLATGADPLMGALASCHLVFIAGDAPDPAFMALREALLKSVSHSRTGRPRLIVTILRETTGYSMESVKPGPGECVVTRAHGDDPLPLILDIYSALKLQGIICVDLADVELMTAGKKGIMAVVRGATPERIVEGIGQDRRIRAALSDARTAFAVFSMDIDTCVTLEQVSDMGDALRLMPGAPPDLLDLCLAADVIRTVPEGFRAAMIICG
ncbi:MAG: hypothetical protein ACOZF0_20945 [Thermodesulfobacteriota bacterium]